MLIIHIRPNTAAAMGWQMVVAGIRNSFGHVVFPELFTGRLGDLESGNWRNFMGIHRSHDFGCDQDQQFVLFDDGLLGAEEQGADGGDVTQQRNPTDFCLGSV